MEGYIITGNNLSVTESEIDKIIQSGLTNTSVPMTTANSTNLTNQENNVKSANANILNLQSIFTTQNIIIIAIIAAIIIGVLMI
ncbi:MAG: hypothetical protein QXU98_09610 [Candidatus Parvarchaeota archaeon]